MTPPEKIQNSSGNARRPLKTLSKTIPDIIFADATNGIKQLT